MSYQNESVLEALPVDVSSLQDYTSATGTEDKIAWLESELLVPIDEAGHASTQEDYERAYDKVFATLEELNRIFKNQKYILGDTISPADIRLYSVLVRFDTIFYFAYRLNLHKIKDYPELFRYAKELYHTEAFHKVTDLNGLKNAYYEAQTDVLNPYHLVMVGPDMSDWDN